MHTKLYSAYALVFILVGAGGKATAQTDGQQCEVTRPLPAQRMLRRLSLDLRGRIPSTDEIAAQDGAAEVTEETVQSYLDSEDFVEVMRAHHANLLWPNIDQIELIPDTHVLFPYPLGDGNLVYLSALRSAFVRTAGPGALFVPCRNEPATFDAQGRLILEPLEIGGQIVAYQEGYVEVAPYWAPDTTIKVCGLDALDATQGIVCPGPRARYPFADDICQQFEFYGDGAGIPVIGTQTPCDGPLALLAPECGCGPNLQYCATPEITAEIRQSLLEQELRVVDRVLRDDQPYDQILLTPTVEFNGPISHYLRYMSNLTFDTYAGPDASAPAPNMPYTDRRWVPVERSGRHAGVLTTPGYLLKFQTGRQRAHRFYNAFECASFIPNGPLPSPFAECSQREDLSQRCGCDACHKTLEPMASHWGRFAEYGFLPLDETDYPTVIGPSCLPPYDNIEQLFDCFRFYELDPQGEEEAYRGFLTAYVFRTPDQRRNIEEGPARLVADSLASGRLDRCTVRRMWTHFMRREPNLEEDGTVIPALTTAYTSSDRSIKTLIKEIVQH
ncbi:MAG: hypothetical protein AAF449_22025, partial [Myxococcota bacterium]